MSSFKAVFYLFSSFTLSYNPSYAAKLKIIGTISKTQIMVFVRLVFLILFKKVFLSKDFAYDMLSY
jgi:hypothetical protein